jgi:hypothetical protein
MTRAVILGGPADVAMLGQLVKGMGRLIVQSRGPNDFASPKVRVIDKTG